jgi:hypothetical protein
LGTTCTEARQGAVPRKPALPEVVLTGCLVQGTSSTVFIFDNAKKDATSALEKGERYLLTSVVEDVDLRTHLNHMVRITGEVDLRVSTMPIREPVGSNPRAGEERTLPRLNARSITLVSDKCSMAGERIG